MNDRWVCKRCFADNEETDSACQRCGLIRGAEATEADQEGWASADGTAASQPRQRPVWQSLLRYWWVPALAIVLAVGWFTTARRDADGSLETAGTVSVNDLRAGDCFNGASGEETLISDVDGVPCDQAHEYEVFAVANHEAEAFPASDADVEAVFATVCVPPFESFVGTPYADSELWASIITPSEDSWADGDRSFICVLYEPGNPTLTASMEGSNR